MSIKKNINVVIFSFKIFLTHIKKVHIYSLFNLHLLYLCFLFFIFLVKKDLVVVCLLGTKCYLFLGFNLSQLFFIFIQELHIDNI
jgi:hypothetical protein